MLFNSYIFIFIFLPITLGIYFFLNFKRLTKASKLFLVIASLFFYSWWNVIYLPLILTSMVFNYLIGTSLNSNNKSSIFNKKQILVFGIICNLILLGYFKYVDFFISNINYCLNSDIKLLKLALPLAISFFTFQQIAYLVDSYGGETKEYNFINYAIFVTFFPQLIAGPIVHHREMMPQFSNLKNKIFSNKNFATGFYLFTIGLFKKVVIADSFAPWANRGFDVAENLNMLEAWATSLSYSFQLYFDFSGYTDMALGIGLMFNIKLPINFNSPYKSLSIKDFWRHWHITLSRFLRDYIYIPLGGNRLGEFKMYKNLMITFLIGGLWHGAGWTFIFWGFLHGIALIINQIWSKRGFKLNTFLSWFLTFNFVNITWIFFRATNWNDALKVLDGMFNGNLVLPAKLASKLPFLSKLGLEFGSGFQKIGSNTEIISSLIAAFFIILILKNSNKLTKTFVPSLANFIIVCIMFVYSVIAFLTTKSDFLYFDF